MARVTHGLSHTREYYEWVHVKQRCDDPKCPQYKNYGGRGIRNKLGTFEEFHAFNLTHGYADHLTLDRIDTDGDYAYDNIRWVDWKTQQNNRRNNVRLSDGRTLTQFYDDALAEGKVAEGVSVDAFRARVRQCGWSLEDALTRPSMGLGGDRISRLYHEKVNNTEFVSGSERMSKRDCTLRFSDGTSLADYCRSKGIETYDLLAHRKSAIYSRCTNVFRRHGEDAVKAYIDGGCHVRNRH